MFPLKLLALGRAQVEGNPRFGFRPVGSPLQDAACCAFHPNFAQLNQEFLAAVVQYQDGLATAQAQDAANLVGSSGWEGDLLYPDRVSWKKKSMHWIPLLVNDGPIILYNPSPQLIH